LPTSFPRNTGLSARIWLAPGATTVGAKEIAPETYADFDRDGL
jgi:hypothetical protein